MTFKKEVTVTEVDRRHMRRALELARKASGQTFPNPLVGCVVVKNDKVIGEGFHPKAGKPHAEVYALRAAGQQANGSTVYVTLEPCSHFGLTPPCSRALLEVVIGMTDPNPLVQGKGARLLEESGVDVVTGCLEEECGSINKDFVDRIRSS